MPESTWILDGHYIKATVYPKGSTQSRESMLDLDLCCRLSSTLSEQFFLTYIRAPDDLAHPNSNQLLKRKLSEEENTSITYAGNGKLHSKKTLKGWIWDSHYESDFDANSCLRFSDDGRIEFVHLPYVDDTPKWARVLFNALASYEKSAKATSGLSPIGGELEKHLDELMDKFQKWILSKNLDANVQEWLQGTYVDGDGKLIRRGT